LGLMSWILVGLTAGLMAWRLVPDRGLGAAAITMVLGMSGASLGGFAAGLIGETGPTEFSLFSVPAAVFGAAALLFAYDLLSRRAA